MTTRFDRDDDKAMDPEKRKAIEAAGWKVGDAADFLEMNDEERQLLDSKQVDRK